MKKLIILILAITFGLFSCQKEQDIRKVKYQINGLGLPYKIIYLDKDGNTVKDSIKPTATNKVWKLEFDANEGDLVYLYIEYKEKLNNNMNFSSGIYIDGKAYQQAKSYDMIQVVGTDTTYKIKRSGVVPFSN